MGEIKNRSIRLDDDNWSWLSSLPGKTSNEAVGELKRAYEDAWEKVMGARREFENEVLGRLRMLPETFMGTMDEYKAIQAEKKRIDGEVARIQGVWESAGQVAKAYEGAVAEVSRFDRGGLEPMPVLVEKPFRVMCQHCGVKFGSESLKETTCEGCGGKDHKGSRYECEVCRYG